MPDWVTLCDLAAQWGGKPWDIDPDTLPLEWVERSRLYQNFRAQKQAKAQRTQTMRDPGKRRTFGG